MAASEEPISNRNRLKLQETKMILVRQKGHFSTTSCRAAKHFCSATANALMILAAAMLLSAAAQFAVAQDIFGRVVGTVTDPSGAAVPDVKVTIADEATQATRDVTSDRNGYFVADELPVGTYSVMAEKAGFKRIIKKGIVVTAGGRLTVDFIFNDTATTET